MPSGTLRVYAVESFQVLKGLRSNNLPFVALSNCLVPVSTNTFRTHDRNNSTPYVSYNQYFPRKIMDMGSSLGDILRRDDTRLQEGPLCPLLKVTE